MSRTRDIILVVAWAAAVVGAGVVGHRVLREITTPTSPVALETAQEKADSVQAAFARGAVVKDAEVEGFVTRVQAAVRERDKEALAGMVAMDRMLDGVDAATDKSLPAAARTMLETRLAGEALELFDANVVETRIKRIDRDAQGNIVVYLHMIDADRTTIKGRWWLYHDGEGLKWWDSEDLQLGLRIGTVMAASIALSRSSERRAEIERFIAVISRLATLAMDDPEQVRAMAADLDGLALDGLPASFRHLAMSSRISMAVAQGEAEEALRRLDTLESEGLQPLDIPMRHYLRASASYALDRYDATVEAAERYLALLGGDAEAYFLVGAAKLGLGDTKAAMIAFDQGIDDDPWLPSSYSGAAMATDDVAALAERLRKVPDDAVLDGAAQWIVDAEDGESLTRLLDAAKTARPSWDPAKWRAMSPTTPPAEP